MSTCIKINFTHKEDIDTLNSYFKNASYTTIHYTLENNAIYVYSEQMNNSELMMFVLNDCKKLNVSPGKLTSLSTEVLWYIAGGKTDKFADCTIENVSNPDKFNKLFFYASQTNAESQFKLVEKITNFNSFVLVKRVNAYDGDDVVQVYEIILNKRTNGKKIISY